MYAPRFPSRFPGFTLFKLLALLGIGFVQGLYALDAADGSTEHPLEVINLLVQALLQCVSARSYVSSKTDIIFQVAEL